MPASRLSRLCLWLGLLGLVLAAVGHPALRPAPAQAQFGNPPLPIVSAPLQEHPRLLITQPYIEQTLRPRMMQESLAWRHFIAYVRSTAPEDDLPTHSEAVMRSLALAYHMTGETAFAERAQAALLTMVQDISSHPAMTGDSPWDQLLAERVAGVALGYDWLYDTLNDTDKSALRDILLRAMSVLNNPERDSGRVYVPNADGSYRFAAYEAESLWVLWAGAAVGIALAGDDFRAPEYLDYARNLFVNWTLPALEAQSGGAWAEGPYTGFRAHWASVQLATAFWTARGENYFDDIEWWYDRLAYQAFLSYPHLVQEADLYFWDYPAVFGDSPRQHSDAFYGRAQMMLLSTVFAGTEQAAWANWFLAQGEAAPMLQRWLAVEEFLWRDESAEGFPPPWLYWYSSNSGHVLARSAWTDVEGTLATDATVLTFNAGDHYATRQYFDQGSITLWRAGDPLLVHSGVYSGTGQQDQDANHLSRSIAANTLLICDLAENFDQIRPNEDRQVWLNDCGQRPVFPNPASAINPYFQEQYAAGYETGEILRFSTEGGLNYFRADLSPAYNSSIVTAPGNRPKVESVQRELVYIRPGAVVLYDRIITPRADFVPLHILNTHFEPSYDGFWWALEGEQSQLYIAQVVPGVQTSLEDAYQVAGEAIQVTGERFGSYRLQSGATSPANQQHFLTLLLADERSAPAPGLWEYVQGESVIGVAWADWQVIFDDDPGNLSAASFPVTAQAANVLIIGLLPGGSYTLTLPDGSEQALSADEAGTLYLFNGSNGLISLQQQ